MANIPTTMRSLVATRYGPPSEWVVQEMPVPRMEKPDDVLIKVHAASLKTADTQIASGAFRRLVHVE